MKRKPTALKFTDAEIDGTALKEHTKGEKPKEPATDPSKKAHRRKKRAATNYSKQAKTAALRFEENESWFCFQSDFAAIPNRRLVLLDKTQRSYAKKPSKLTHTAKSLPTDLAVYAVRSNLHEDSEDNTGVESVDAAIGTVQTVSRLSHDSKRSKEFRDNKSSEYSGNRSGNTVQNGNRSSSTPSGSTDSNTKSRQKASIKKDYARKAKDNADNAKSASETASNIVSRIKDGVGKIAEYIGSHKTAVAIIAVIALMVLFILGIMSSCSVFIQSGVSGLGISTYPSKDEDMLSAEGSYKSLEEALNQSIQDYELTHGYNEYYYNIGEIGHDPYVLISALTAIYGGEWTAADVSELIQRIFDAQYVLSENVITETRYYTDYVTEYIWIWDDYWQNYVQIPVTTEIQVPYDYFICTVTLESKDLEEAVTKMMTDEQKTVYFMYMEMKGNRHDLFE